MGHGEVGDLHAAAGLVSAVSYNDFVIKFANVNGSGSASANGLFAKALFRMGIPVALRNIFPSNIEGLPTWFEVRVSEQEYLGRREGVDIMVAMNAQTYREDIESLRPGGFLVYDSSKPLARELERPDIIDVGIPIASLLLTEFNDLKQRQLFKNIVYVGALSALLDIDFTILTAMVSDQYKGKDALIRPNIHALELGRQYAQDYLDAPLPIRVRATDAVGDRIMIDGNTAAALGCIYGGATVAAWYPITPSSSMAEAFERYVNQLRLDPETGNKKGVVIQAEDELAAIGIVIGAAWNGARAFTSTSGPGVSLMGEFLGLAYFAEIPAVLFDIQRAGPSTGMPTRTQQGDLLSVAYASHGDTKHPILIPGSPLECFEFAAEALDLADQLQTPVVVLSDLELGMNEHLSPPLVWDDARKYERGKVLTAEELDSMERFGRYLDVDGDGIGYRTYPGTHPDKGAFFTRGTSRDEYAQYTEAPEAYTANMDRLLKKWETAKKLVPQPEIIQSTMPRDYGVIYYGSSDMPMGEALERLEEEGIELDQMRIRGFPFAPEVFEFIRRRQQVFVIDQNRDAQMRMLLINEGDVEPAKLVSVRYYGGLSISADFIADQISAHFEGLRRPRLSEVKP
jgi:2-oxoglutarate ferredoxin oxidoreductase subunit alpha